MSKHRDPREPSDEPSSRLSAIIPGFDAAETIGEQRYALTEQDWREPWELIIADNGSTDGTPQMVEPYCERIRHLRVVESPGRKGAEHARNEGVKAAMAGKSSRTKRWKQFAYRWGLVRGNIQWRTLVL